MISGAFGDRRSLRIGAVLDLSGADADSSELQARGIQLAVSQLNAVGGVQLRADKLPRPITFIACDGFADTHGALNALDELDVKMIIGPARSGSFAKLASDDALPSDALLHASR